MKAIDREEQISNPIREYNIWVEKQMRTRNKRQVLHDRNMLEMYMKFTKSTHDKYGNQLWMLHFSGVVTDARVAHEELRLLVKVKSLRENRAITYDEIRDIKLSGRLMRFFHQMSPVARKFMEAIKKTSDMIAKQEEQRRIKFEQFRKKSEKQCNKLLAMLRPLTEQHFKHPEDIMASVAYLGVQAQKDEQESEDRKLLEKK